MAGVERAGDVDDCVFDEVDVKGVVVEDRLDGVFEELDDGELDERLDADHVDGRGGVEADLGRDAVLLDAEAADVLDTASDEVGQGELSSELRQERRQEGVILGGERRRGDEESLEVLVVLVQHAQRHMGGVEIAEGLVEQVQARSHVRLRRCEAERAEGAEGGLVDVLESRRESISRRRGLVGGERGQGTP